MASNLSSQLNSMLSRGTTRSGTRGRTSSSSRSLRTHDDEVVSTVPVLKKLVSQISRLNTRISQIEAVEEREASGSSRLGSGRIGSSRIRSGDGELSLSRSTSDAIIRDAERAIRSASGSMYNNPFLSGETFADRSRSNSLQYLAPPLSLGLGPGMPIGQPDTSSLYQMWIARDDVKLVSDHGKIPGANDFTIDRLGLTQENIQTTTNALYAQIKATYPTQAGVWLAWAPIQTVDQFRSQFMGKNDVDLGISDSFLSRVYKSSQAYGTWFPGDSVPILKVGPRNVFETQYTVEFMPRLAELWSELRSSAEEKGTSGNILIGMNPDSAIQLAHNISYDVFTCELAKCIMFGKGSTPFSQHFRPRGNFRPASIWPGVFRVSSSSNPKTPIPNLILQTKEEADIKERLIKMIHSLFKLIVLMRFQGLQDGDFAKSFPGKAPPPLAQSIDSAERVIGEAFENIGTVTSIINSSNDLRLLREYDIVIDHGDTEGKSVIDPYTMFSTGGNIVSTWLILTRVIQYTSFMPANTAKTTQTFTLHRKNTPY